MTEESKLLSQFAHQNDQTAFGQWVELRLPLVYSTALRILRGDAGSAQDVAQQVFIDAAKQAKSLARHPAIAAWLFTSTRFTAAKIIRANSRRAQREHTAAMDPSLQAVSIDWNSVRPVLDDVLAELSDSDREAIIRRFFDQADFKSIGGQLSLSPNAARMRVDRALDKLCVLLRKRGISSTTAALGTVMTANTIVAAPAGLATAISAQAMATSVGLSTAGLLGFLFAHKFPLGLSLAIAVVGSTSLSVQSQPNSMVYTSHAADPPLNRSQSTAHASTRTDATTAAGHAIHDDDLQTLREEERLLREELDQLEREFSRRLKRIAASERVHPFRELDLKPKPIRQRSPQYPPELMKAGTEGLATIEFVVNENGQIQDLRTIEATHPEFARAAMEALATWEFEPGVVDEKAVNTRMQIPLRFTIDTEKKIQSDVWF
ncbi:MAG: hypothetical protein SynsKO_03320 [Synoicihabitans sp.]